MLVKSEGINVTVLLRFLRDVSDGPDRCILCSLSSKVLDGWHSIR